MDTENQKLVTLTWGLLLIWLGVWWSIPEGYEIFPEGVGAIGIGVILLGLNAARWLKGISIGLCSTSLGVLFLIWGGMKLICPLLNCAPCEPSALGIFLVIFGAVLLTRELLRIGRTA